MIFLIIIAEKKHKILSENSIIFYTDEKDNSECCIGKFQGKLYLGEYDLTKFLSFLKTTM